MPPNFAQIQCANSKPKIKLLPDKITCIQKVTSSLPCFAHSLDNILLPELNIIDIGIYAAEDDTLINIDHMLHCTDHNPNPKTHYKIFDMILRVLTALIYMPLRPKVGALHMCA